MEINLKRLLLTFDAPDGEGTLEGPITGTLELTLPQAPAPEPEPDYDVAVSPGESIQAAVDANPEGTRFLLRAGIHRQQQVIPKTGNVFDGEDGAVLDGEDVAEIAFQTGPAPYPANVEIRGLEICNYASPDQRAAVEAGLYSTEDASEGWIIENNEIHQNACIGVRLGNRAKVKGNYIHHNHCMNLGGSGDEAIVENNRIEFGNYEYRYVPGDQAGGLKFTVARWMVVRNNTFYKNCGPSLWFDENALDMLIEGNKVDDGDTEGIVIEICYRATIRNNVVTNCGWRDNNNRYDWLWNAGIAIHSSPACEVYGNNVSSCWSGIVAHQQDRYSNEPNPPVYGQHIVTDLWVHDNHVDQQTEPTGSQVAVAAGLANDAGNMETFESLNNRFTGNTYSLGPAPQPFCWANSTRTEEEWKAYGQQ
jgi:nitrous oxidase accessory protein NosD